MSLLVFFLLFVQICQSVVVHTSVDTVFEHAKSKFGLDYTTNNFTGYLRKADPFYGCDLSNRNLSNSIVLVTRDTKRDNCSFVQKVFNAQEKGASGVIVMGQKPLRWEEDSLLAMGEGTKDEYNITIPNVYIVYQSGMTLLSLMESYGNSTTATISVVGEKRPSELSFGEILWLFVEVIAITYVSLFSVIGIAMLYRKWTLRKRRFTVYGIKNYAFSAKKEKDTENVKECVICLEKLKENDIVKKLPCGHVFHEECVTPWLIEKKGICPTCRQGVYDRAVLNYIEENRSYTADQIMDYLTKTYLKNAMSLFNMIFIASVLLVPVLFAFLM